MSAIKLSTQQLKIATFMALCSFERADFCQDKEEKKAGQGTVLCIGFKGHRTVPCLKAALTELFNGVKNSNTPVIVERIVTDIDDIVRIIRFDGWQDTNAGKREVKKALRSVVSVKYKIKDKDVFDKAYNYIEMYY